MCVHLHSLELGRSELGWLGRAKNNGLREGRRGGRTDNCGGGGEIWPAWFNTLQVRAQMHWNTYSQNTNTKGEMWPAWFDALFDVRRAIKNCAGSDVLSMKECCNHRCALQCLKIAALSTLQSFSSEPATTFLLLCPILLSETAVVLVLVRCLMSVMAISMWWPYELLWDKFSSDVDQPSQYLFRVPLRLKGLCIIGL